ncbi:MAG: type II toxin-antitoxin system HicB family antitoxin [Desulfurococcales archaeon]|nr:type II toxin-antitoxin system HicB family antitoxin [Desulfurococcales archaeon]
MSYARDTIYELVRNVSEAIGLHLEALSEEEKELLNISQPK